MAFRFPNARLYVHNLVAGNGLSGAQAIAGSAIEFGLIDADSAAEIHLEPGSDGCQCKDAAKEVLKKYFKRKGKNCLDNIKVEEIWSLIERDADVFIKSTRAPEKSGNGSGHGSGSGGCSGGEQPHNCARYAPALFDLMLQQISRYP